MRFQRQLFSALLMLLFLGGGILGPSLHRIEHAKQRHDKHTAAFACEHDAYDDAAHAHLLPLLQDEVPCPLCTRNHFTADIAQLGLDRPQVATSHVPPVRSVHVANLSQHHFIRGPPARA